MESVIEVQRQTHEEIERFERALADVLSYTHNSQNEALASQHKASNILDRITSRVSTLNDLYKDVEGTRAHELEQLSSNASAQDDLTEFYTRLEKIKDYHHKYPDMEVAGFELELAGILGELDVDDENALEDPVALLFTGEENYGRYVDVNAHYMAYNNLKDVPKRLSYLQYLDVLTTVTGTTVHPELERSTKHTKDYESYLQSLHAYLLSFTKRTQPLVDVDKHQHDAEAEFEKLWGEGQLSEWQNSANNSAKGGDATSEGVWCAACQKLYAKQTVYDAHLKSKKHLKAAARTDAPDSTPNGTNGTPDATTTRSKSKLYTPARLTHLIQQLLQDLHPTIVESRANVERRFSLTSRERELELETPAPSAPAPAAGTAPAEEEEEEEKIYNPLKLPLGWDGKPIPYWLYKLHGLGVEYRCEICSDAVYMGRKNFDRHFQESRHAFGMRALGLPNTKHFHEITRIEDALALAERLKQEGKQEIFQNETMEELEDDEGNVYNKKTYDDLKKQGLI